MKRIVKQSQMALLLLLMFMLHIGSACNLELSPIEGSEKTATEERSIRSFIALKVSGGIEVELTQSQTESLVVTADDNILPLIESIVSDGVLRIGLKEPVRNVGTMKVSVSFKKLESIDISGAVRLYGTNNMSFEHLELEGSGASEFRLDLKADYLVIDMSGASNANLKGNANKLKVDASGASKVYADSLESGSAVVDASGASLVEVWASESIVVDASGASGIRYKGAPKQIQQNTSGASSVSPL